MMWALRAMYLRGVINLASSSRNLGTKSGLKKFDMRPECSARQDNRITSNYLLIGVENKNEKEAKSWTISG
jgi:hypothetical protein